jgi:hypothetical protein
VRKLIYLFCVLLISICSLSSQSALSSSPDAVLLSKATLSPSDFNSDPKPFHPGQDAEESKEKEEKEKDENEEDDEVTAGLITYNSGFLKVSIFLSTSNSSQGFHKAVRIPLYILFHCWKQFLN